jgi:hypothetical protein
LVAAIPLIIRDIIRGRMPEQAKKAYCNSLRRLQQDPNNPDLRADTVRLGREYAALAKDSKGRSTFDEVAIANDLQAACARATTGENSVAKVEVTNIAALNSRSIAEEIERLGQLFLTGVVTAEEFERGKALFLGTPVDKAAVAVEFLQNLDALKKEGILSQSEFNMKKWEILSERLLPGKGQAAALQPQAGKSQVVGAQPQASKPPQGQRQIMIACPWCGKSLTTMVVSSTSRLFCPHCQRSFGVETGS